MTSSHIWL